MVAYGNLNHGLFLDSRRCVSDIIILIHVFRFLVFLFCYWLKYNKNKVEGPLTYKVPRVDNGIIQSFKKSLNTLSLNIQWAARKSDERLFKDAWLWPNSSARWNWNPHLLFTIKGAAPLRHKKDFSRLIGWYQSLKKASSSSSGWKRN